MIIYYLLVGILMYIFSAYIDSHSPLLFNILTFLSTIFYLLAPTGNPLCNFYQFLSVNDKRWR